MIFPLSTRDAQKNDFILLFFRGLQQPIVRIKVVHGRRGQKLVINEHRRWHWLLTENIEAEPYQVGTVTLRKERNRTDQLGIWSAQFCAAFGRRILSHHGTRIGAAGFFKRPQRANCADVIDRTYDQTMRVRLADMLANDLETWA